MRRLLNILKCCQCQAHPKLEWQNESGFCPACNSTVLIKNGIIHYTDANELQTIPEVAIRDRQATGYLCHAKFPIQIFRLKQFLRTLPQAVRDMPVLDLGCGPGPSSQILTQEGYRVLAVDFSEESLKINRQLSNVDQSEAIFVCADLTKVIFHENSTRLLVMCDFLQHLGNREVRAKYLRDIFQSLQPGGYFYLSFFNFNLKNYLKGDLYGWFSNGNIAYERLIPKDVINMLPKHIDIDAITPINISHTLFDRFLTKLPGALYLSRMVQITGRKKE